MHLVFKKASRIDAFGISYLQGGAVEAFGKVTRFAKTVLPTWVIWKCVKQPAEFDWQMDLSKRTILLGVLNASDGNCSHAVTVHGGFIYNANELVAIPLCQQAPTEKSMFVNFCRISLFYYEGRHQEKVKRMSLFDQTEIVEKKRKFVSQTILK